MSTKILHRGLLNETMTQHKNLYNLLHSLGEFGPRKKGRSRMPRKDNETSLVKSILQYLSYKGVFAWRNQTGATKIGERFIRFGQPGSPDIIGILPTTGRMLCIEAKVGRNKTTELQNEWLQRAESLGALCIVARSIDDVSAHL